MRIYPYSENKKSPIPENRALKNMTIKSSPFRELGLRLFLHPAIFQCHGAVKHEMIWSRIFV